MTDKIEEIRKRHVKALQTPSDWWTVMGDDANRDRHTLLAEVDRLRAEVERLTGIAKQVAETLSATTTKHSKMGDEVDRLDEDNARLSHERDTALAKNERLRDALRWYADPRNHSPIERRYPGASVVFLEQPIMNDGGRRARRALNRNL